MASWLDLFSAALAGGIVAKAVEILYSEYRRRSEAEVTAKATVARHLDPILKAADELSGKLSSLAKDDFKELAQFRDFSIDADDLNRTVSVTNIGYLFAHFWARLEVFRKESLFVHISADETGRRLLEFMRCLESTRVRLVDRAWQRAMGESLIQRADGKSECLDFHQFVETFRTSEHFREWHKPLLLFVLKSNYTKERQLVLQYGVILHAFIDTLDPKHQSTRDRPPYPHKLTKKTKKSLRHRVFKVYLPSVKNAYRYTHLSS